MPKLRIATSVPAPADVAVRRVKGPAAVPPTCSAPCTVEVAELGTYEVSVHAPGYYPATMRVSHDQIINARHAFGGRDALLVVPLRKRADAVASPE